jgi:two-component system nitrogen regulation sensor histidine kinase GlnL
MNMSDGQAGLLLESLNTAIVLLDADLRVLFLNSAAENLFAVSARQVQKAYWPDIVGVSNGLVQRIHSAMEDLSPYTEHELEIQHSPNRKTVNCTVTPLASCQLLIEMFQVDQQIRVSRGEQLLVQQQAARELLRGLAHEIKNPLGGLRGAAQLLEQELGDPELREYTGVIIAEADRLRNLVDRMLGPSNVPRKRSVNIHEILERVCSLVEAGEHRHLQIIREYDPSIPDINADPELLVQAILNIVLNAAQVGSNRVTIVTRVRRHMTIGHENFKLVALVQVVDDGPGINPEMREKVFYPMVTGRAQGTGLGLSIAQSLVNEHGGLVECESRPGETTFTILLPLES